MMKMNVSPAIFTVWHTREYLKSKVTRAGIVFTFEFKSLINEISSHKLHTKHAFMNKNQHIILFLTVNN